MSSFGRSYRVSIGLSGGGGFESYNSLRVAFSFQKSAKETCNTGKLSIWNLNKEHLAMLDQQDVQCSFYAGYGSRMSLIFSGIAAFSSTSMDGADRKTEIEVVDSLVEVRDTYVSVSYDSTMSWKDIMNDTADKMGLAIEYSYNATFKDVINGYRYVGQGKNILTSACECCGLEWSIQNGIIQVKKKGDTMNTSAYTLSASTGMVEIPQKVLVSRDTDGIYGTIGWDVKYLLNGAIGVGDMVNVSSDVISGIYSVYSVEHSGDSKQGDWISKARLLEVTNS